MHKLDSNGDWDWVNFLSIIGEAQGLLRLYTSYRASISF